jgi:hypothetical protein
MHISRKSLHVLGKEGVLPHSITKSSWILSSFCGLGSIEYHSIFPLGWISSTCLPPDVILMITKVATNQPLNHKRSASNSLFLGQSAILEASKSVVVLEDILTAVAPVLSLAKELGIATRLDMLEHVKWLVEYMLNEFTHC